MPFDLLPIRVIRVIRGWFPLVPFSRYAPLERFPYSEFEIVAGFTDAERQPAHRAGVTAADTAGIESKDEPEGLVDHRHHDLQLDPGADTHARIRAGQKMNAFLPHMSGSIHLFSKQRPLFEYPAVADVRERSQRDRPRERYAIFQIEYPLGITADINDIVILDCRGSACDWVRQCSRAR